MLLVFWFALSLGLRQGRAKRLDNAFISPASKVGTAIGIVEAAHQRRRSNQDERLMSTGMVLLDFTPMSILVSIEKRVIPTIRRT